MSVERLEAAVDEVVRGQRWRLMARFGYTHGAAGGWQNHNLTHATDVGERGAALAGRLVASGDLPPETPALARLAGYFHDDVQLAEHVDPGYRTPRGGCGARLEAQALSPQREELSAEAALTAMRRYNERTGAEVFTANSFATVEEMIEATKVVGRTGTQLVQNASPDRPVAAVLADADLSQFGRADGVWQSLAFHGETEWLQGRVAPPPSGSLRALPLSDPDRTAGFLADQQALFRDHQYLLEHSPALFPHQELNSGRLGELHGGIVDGRLDWQGAVDRAGGWARAESSRRVDGTDRRLSGGRRMGNVRRVDRSRPGPEDGRG